MTLTIALACAAILLVFSGAFLLLAVWGFSRAEVRHA